MLVDARDVAELKRGSFPGAVNIPIGELEGKLDSLPADKTLVFFCSSGGRGGEAHDLAKLLRPELKTVFLDAEVSFAKDGTWKITPHG